MVKLLDSVVNPDDTDGGPTSNTKRPKERWTGTERVDGGKGRVEQRKTSERRKNTR